MTKNDINKNHELYHKPEALKATIVVAPTLVSGLDAFCFLE